MTNIGWKFYMVFVCLNFVDLIIITLFFPETKGASAIVLCLFQHNLFNAFLFGR